jgi:hypothetical protein
MISKILSMMIHRNTLSLKIRDHIFKASVPNTVRDLQEMYSVTTTSMWSTMAGENQVWYSSNKTSMLSVIMNIYVLYL